jgi:hypothetical protein
MRSLCCYLFSIKQKQKSINAEPNSEQNEELDVVEAFKTCHTSSKNGLDEAAREAIVSLTSSIIAPWFL